MRPKKYKTELQRLLAKKLNALRGRCKHGRRKAIYNEPEQPFDLTTEWLFKQYELQKGKCFYTGIPMKLKTNGTGGPMWNSMSFDRIDDTKGYVIGHVVLSIHKVNLVKNRFDIGEVDIINKVYSQKFIKQLEKAKRAIKTGKKNIRQ